MNTDSELSGAKFGIYLENNLKVYAKTTDFSGDLNGTDDWTEFFRAVRNGEVKADGKTIALTDIPTAKVFENDSSKLSGLTATGVKNQYSVDWLTTGDDGYASSPELPYGKYVVYEVATPNDQLDPAQAMYAVITEDSRTPQTLRFSYLDYDANRYIEIIKKDGDTAKTVLKAGTQYLIYSCDEDGQYSERDLIRQYYKDGNRTIAIGTRTNPWTTDQTGVITTVEELEAGYYAVHEITAVEGYYNAQQDVIFKVDSEQTYDYRPIYDGDEIIGYDEYLTVAYTNPETRGQLTIEKYGETVSGFAAPNFLARITNFFGLTDERDFTYEESLLDGATYLIKAAEDIYTSDGQDTLWYKKGETVAVAVTGKDGTVTYNDNCEICGKLGVTYTSSITNTNCPYAAISNTEAGKVSITLPLGQYTVTEIHAPYGYVLDEEDKTVALVWHDQNEEISSETVTFHNPRTHTPENPSTPDEETGNGYVKLTKTDSLDGEPVAGAVFGFYNSTPIYSHDGEEIVPADTLLTTVTTDAEGVATVTLDLPLMDEGYTAGSMKNSGDYYFVELEAAEYYELDDTPQAVHVEYKDQFTWIVGARASMTNKLYGSPDLVISKAVDKETVQETDCAGGVAYLTYTLDVANNGDGLAKKVTIIDTMPENVTYISSTPAMSYDEETAACTWTLGKMAPGAVQQITVNVIVNSDAHSGDVIENLAYVDALNNFDENGDPADPIPSNEVETVVIAPIMSIAKRQALNDGAPTSDKLKAEAGDEITYYVDITNDVNATSDAFDVAISDTIPEGMEYVAGSADNDGIYDTETGTLCWNIGTLEIGGTRTVSFKVKVPTTAYHCSFINVATVTASNAPELHAIVGDETPKPVVPDYSPDAEHATILIHYVDKDETPIADDYSIEGDKNADYDVSEKAVPVIEKDTVVYKMVGTGTYGQYETVDGISTDSSPISGKLDSDKEIWIVYQTGSGNPENPLPSNEVVSEVGAPKLEIHKTVDLTEVQQVDVNAGNGTVTYTFSVTNSGDSRACNAIVTDALDSRLSLTSASVEYELLEDSYHFTLGNLAAGETSIFTVEAKISENVVAPASICNIAVVDADNNPDEPVPSEEVETDVVAPILSLIKRQSLNDSAPTTEKIKAQAGDVITYFIEISNSEDATSDAFDVQVKDIIPDGMTYVEGSADNNGSYDAEANTLTWEIGTLTIGASKTMSFQAAIPETAYNAAFVNIATAASSNAPELRASVGDETPEPVEPDYTPDAEHATILIHYVDKDGKPLADDFSVVGDKGAGYDMTDRVYGSVIKNNTIYTRVGTGIFGLFITENGISVDSDAIAGTLDSDKEIWIVYQAGSGSLDDPLPSNEVPNEVGAPKLSISKSVDLAEVQQTDVAKGNAALTYTFVISNDGDTRSCNTTVTDTLPGEVTFVETTADYTVDDGAYIFTLGNVDANETVRFTVTVLVNKEVTAPAKILNACVVDASNNPDEPVPSEEVETDVVAPKISIQKRQAANDGKPSADTLNAQAGDTITYYLDVTNSADASCSAYDVVVSDTLPDGMTYVAESASMNGYIDGSTLSWKLEELKVGETVTISFEAQIADNAANATYKNVAVASADNDPDAAPDKPNPSNEVVVEVTGSSEGQTPAPKTGDFTNLYLWIGLAVAALAGIVVILLCKVKRKKE